SLSWISAGLPGTTGCTFPGANTDPQGAVPGLGPRPWSHGTHLLRQALEELLMPSAAVAPPTDSDIAEAKRRLRVEMIEQRKRLYDRSAGPKLADNVAQLGPFRAGAPVSGFY